MARDAASHRLYEWPLMKTHHVYEDMVAAC